MKLPASRSTVWWNGERIPAEEARIRLSDPGLLAGIGVFETIGVDEGICLDLDAHLERLVAGAARLGVPLVGETVLRRVVSDEAGGLGRGRAWVKIVATRGGACGVFGGARAPDAERPATAVLLPWRVDPRGPLVGLKTLNYAPSVLGLEEARRRGADEGLWLNSRGHLAEGCTSNLFVVRRRKLYTPGERDGILPGITRGLALPAARRLEIPVHVGKLRWPRLAEADEAFLTSSVAGIRPLVRVDGRPVGRGEPGPITEAIDREVDRARRERAGAGV